MKPWGMLLTLAVAFSLVNVGCDAKKGEDEAEKSGDETEKEPGGSGEAAFEYDAWESWNSFDKGAWVECETVFGKNDPSKYARKITEKTDTEIKHGTNILASKPEKKRSCRKCEKEYELSVERQGTETVKVGDKELECYKAAVTNKCDCGEKTSTNWFNKEVPGWMVKMKNDQMEMTCIGYGKE